MGMTEQERRYQQILEDVLEVLEGGDVALDLEDMPGAGVTIRIMADIAGNALKNMKATRELLDALHRKIDTVVKRREQEDKGVTN
tara:strand:- start:4362 stop:4616 length:255 start_codon:yes stop_codon:yes gene_type:complete